jgi:prepilin-type N-terminal cleavage/methylation domain-containing protein
MRLIRNDQRGDTIIEVLIAIAIVSLVLTSAYVITSKNTLAIQNSQERSQAQHLVEAQIEALRAKGSLDNSSDCFVGNVEHQPTESGSPCDSIKATGSGATYKLAVTYDASSGVYTVSATWGSLGGSSDTDSNVTMYYRLQS